MELTLLFPRTKNHQVSKYRHHHNDDVHRLATISPIGFIFTFIFIYFTKSYLRHYKRNPVLYFLLLVVKLQHEIVLFSRVY